MTPGWAPVLRPVLGLEAPADAIVPVLLRGLPLSAAGSSDAIGGGLLEDVLIAGPVGVVR